MALAAANCLYAGAFPASEVALRAIGPLTLTGLRFAIAALVLSPIAVPVIRRLPGRQLARIAAVASIGLWGQMVLIYLGINHSNSAIAAIIVGLEPVLIAVWAALLLSERFVARTAAGLCIGLVGSLLVAGVGRRGRRQPGRAAVPAGHRAWRSRGTRSRASRSWACAARSS